MYIVHFSFDTVNTAFDRKIPKRINLIYYGYCIDEKALISLKLKYAIKQG